MISFELSEEQRLAQSMALELSTSALRPAAREADDRESIPDSVLREIWSTGIVQSQADPAADRSPTLNAILLEELAVADASFAIAAAAPIGFLSAVASQGSRHQKEKLLPMFAGDEYRCAAVAIAEPDFTFDVSAIRTSATRTSAGFRLSGVKGPVPLAGRCSHFLVAAKSEDRMEAFIVDRNAKGVTIGEKQPGLGLRALETATVTFRDVELLPEARLGGDAGCDAQRVVDSARIALAATMTGISRAVFEFVMPYLKQRVVHGAPLAQKQVIAFRLADMRIEVDAMRWMTWKAASILEKGREVSREAQLAYRYAGEQAMWIADEGVQMLGGHGYLRDNPVELWYRNARSVSVLEGAVGV